MGVGGTVEYVGPPEQWPNRNKDFSATDNINKKSKEQPKGAKAKELMPTRGPMMAMAAKALTIPEDTKESTKRQSGDFGVWLYYGKAIGVFPVLLAVFFVCVSTFTTNFPSKIFHCRLWLRTDNQICRAVVAMEYRWINAHSSTICWYLLPRLNLESWSTGRNAIVSLLLELILPVLIVTSQFLMVIGPKSGIRLHDILVKSAFAAPMSVFESMDTSILLNRFSQDMTLIDMQLPLSTFGCLISNPGHSTSVFGD
jgi:ATP-binding cassette subfamily C (CFTR/MRP) protein 1